MVISLPFNVRAPLMGTVVSLLRCMCQWWVCCRVEGPASESVDASGSRNYKKTEIPREKLHVVPATKEKQSSRLAASVGSCLVVLWALQKPKG